MTEADIADWAHALTKKERLILATYEGDTCMPESMERYWNAKALESLIMQEIVKWTMAGYDLTDDGVLLASFLQQKEVKRNQKSSTGKQIKFGEPCLMCETEILKIKRETLQHIIEFLDPKFNSVSQRRIKGKCVYIPICPKCDAYALGIDLMKGFPFIMKNGHESEIQSIATLLWIPDKPFRSKEFDAASNPSDKKKKSK